MNIKKINIFLIPEGQGKELSIWPAANFVWITIKRLGFPHKYLSRKITLKFTQDTLFQWGLDYYKQLNLEDLLWGMNNRDNFGGSKISKKDE